MSSNSVPATASIVYFSWHNQFIQTEEMLLVYVNLYKNARTPHKDNPIQIVSCTNIKGLNFRLESENVWD